MMAVAGPAHAEETSRYVKVVTSRECTIVTPARTQTAITVNHSLGEVITTETNIPATRACANKTRKFIDRRAVRRDLGRVKLPCPFVDSVNGRNVTCSGGAWVYDIEHRCGETTPRIKIKVWPGSTLRKLRAERHAREAIRAANRRARRNGGVERRIRCVLEQREKGWTARIAQRRR